jgi:KaiC/GvpD/RAD55 family RecA-like ATPase
MNQNLVVSEVAYLGSFIAGGREKDFYPLRHTIIDPAEFSDQTSRDLARALDICHTRQEEPNITNLISIMLATGIVVPEIPGMPGHMEAWERLTEILNHYAKLGAPDLKEFRRKEKRVKEIWRAEKISPDVLAQVARDIQNKGGSSIEQALAIRDYIDGLLGNEQAQSQTFTWVEQEQLFTQIPEENRAMIGKPRFMFPISWGLENYIKVIRPGEMIVLSGSTGDGKSALSHQFAEWTACLGRHVLVIHMEDTERTILMRQTCRWIGATMEELERGDPLGKMDQMRQLREKWYQDRGGTLTYKYLAGSTIALIVEHIKDWARQLEDNDETPGLVVLDYFQKVDFPIARGENAANAYSNGAEQLKIIAERLNVPMFVVSQETPNADGKGSHTAYSRALEQKPQIYLAISRKKIAAANEIEEVVVDGERYALADVGDRSCWLHIDIKKANNSRTGSVDLFYYGPRFYAGTKKWLMGVKDGSINAFDIPLLQAWEDSDQQRQGKLFRRWDEGYMKLEPPGAKKKMAQAKKADSIEARKFT